MGSLGCPCVVSSAASPSEERKCIADSLCFWEIAVITGYPSSGVVYIGIVVFVIGFFLMEFATPIVLLFTYMLFFVLFFLMGLCFSFVSRVIIFCCLPDLES